MKKQTSRNIGLKQKKIKLMECITYENVHYIF